MCIKGNLRKAKLLKMNDFHMIGISEHIWRIWRKYMIDVRCENGAQIVREYSSDCMFITCLESALNHEHLEGGWELKRSAMVHQRYLGEIVAGAPIHRCNRKSTVRKPLECRTFAGCTANTPDIKSHDLCQRWDLSRLESSTI